MKIVVEHLKHAYPNGYCALQDVNLTFEGDQPVALIGQNGAGKTTLAKHLNGILKPTSGRVLIDGVDVATAQTAQWARKVGYIFQNPDDQLFLDSVRKEFEFGPHQLGVSQEEIEHRIAKIAELVGLEKKLDSHPFDLSPTEKKFCAIGSVLMMNTGALVFDEPTCGQDKFGDDRLATIISRLKDQGKLCITISHDMKFVARNFPRVVLMRKGQVLLAGSREEVFSRQEILQKAYVTPPPITRVAQEVGIAKPVFTGAAWTEVIRQAGQKGKERG